MIVVTNLSGSSTLPVNNISDDFELQKDVNGLLQVSFTCFPGANSPGYDLINSESIISIDGYELKVKQYTSTSFFKTITAVSTFYENSKKRINERYYGSNTLQSQLNFTFNNNPWTFILENSEIANRSVFIPDFGNDNVVSMFKKIMNYHNLEYEIRPNNILNIRRQIGSDTNYQYRYKHNLESVVIQEDTTNLYTAVRAYGAGDLEVYVQSFTSAIFGVLEAEPIVDDRFQNEDDLRQYALLILQDVPQLTIETQVKELTERDLGDSVFLIYEPLNVDMRTRILKKTQKFLGNELVTKSVVFGNSLKKNNLDLFIQQKVASSENTKYIENQKRNSNNSLEEINGAISVLSNQLNQQTSNLNIRINELMQSISDLRDYVDERLN